jgi:MerR family transcriptional regulator, light-induced transcriptional regulator
MTDAGLLRIGEVSRRSGVSPELLRAWERRYGLLHPTRSTGGLRLYSPEDLERVRAMQHHLSTGLAAAEAAALAAASSLESADPPVPPVPARRELEAALSAFDEARAQGVIDSTLAATTLDTALSDFFMPYLRELGERWQRGEASVAQEHFASSVLRGRLLGLARGWDRGLGPRILLACAPGEQHDLGLIAFGLALRARGWRIGYLGADTPLESVASAASAFEPAFIVISSVTPELFSANRRELRALGHDYSLALGGAGAAGDVGVKARLLPGGPVEEAERLTRLTV